MSVHLRCQIFRVNSVISRMRLLKKEQVYHCLFVCFLGFFFFWGGGGGGGGGGGEGDYLPPEQVY